MILIVIGIFKGIVSSIRNLADQTKQLVPLYLLLFCMLHLGLQSPYWLAVLVSCSQLRRRKLYCKKNLLTTWQMEKLISTTWDLGEQMKWNSISMILQLIHFGHFACLSSVENAIMRNANGSISSTAL